MKYLKKISKQENCNKIKVLKENIKINKESNVGWHWLDDDTFVSEFKINDIAKEILGTENNSLEIEYQLDTGRFYYSAYGGEWDDLEETCLITHIDMSAFDIDVLNFVNNYALKG